MTPPKEAFSISTELFGDLVAAEGAPVDEIAALAEYARQIASKAKSANTKRSYRSQWANYVRYCDSLGLKPLSGDPAVVGLFLAALRRDGKRLSTIRSHLSAVSTAHRLAGLRLGLGHRAIDSVLEGLKREMGVRPIKEAPPLLDTATRASSRFMNCQRRSGSTISTSCALNRFDRFYGLKEPGLKRALLSLLGGGATDSADAR